MIEVEELGLKAQTFFKNYLPVHCKFKRGYWLRGYILSVEAEFFMLNEFKLGERLVFFAELDDIEQFRNGVK